MDLETRVSSKDAEIHKLHLMLRDLLVELHVERTTRNRNEELSLAEREDLKGQLTKRARRERQPAPRAGYKSGAAGGALAALDPGAYPKADWRKLQWGPPVTDCRAALELMYSWARQRQGIIVLIRPSIQVAVSAVRGTLESRSIHGPTRVYIADPSRQQLTLLFGELKKINLAGEVTLYHGSLTEFFRDLPLRADLICANFDALDLGAGGLRSVAPAGALILSLKTGTGGADPAAPKYLIDSGILELEAVSEGGASYHATPLCRGGGFVPPADLRLILQGKLHERYFLSEAATHASHTPVADLTEDIRREFSREFPAASGSGAWPYVAPESAGLPLTLPSGKPWPKVSIVTPTRNQGKYIEETILSVLHQGYPNVEHIIVDGASTDETPSILERYRDKLALVISEPDNGQSQAINKGMSKATGDILTWLNSDDMLAPGALASVALALDLNRADMISGVCRLYQDGRLIAQHVSAANDGPLPLEDLLDLDHGWTAGQFFQQPEVMFTREIWLRAGGHLDEQLFYSMDYELWLRFARAGARLHVIGRPLAWFRVHPEQKTYAMSSYVPELTACRDAFLRENGLAPQPPPEALPGVKSCASHFSTIMAPSMAPASLTFGWLARWHGPATR